MPAIVVPNGAVLLGAGYLYKAPLATTKPANTVTGSVFTDAWPAAWIPIGVTREGTEWSHQVNTDTVEVAEYLDPLKIVSTGRNIGVSFEVVQITANNFKLGMNGGTVTTTGTGATSMTTFTPPAVGSEVRTMLGWESEDGTVRSIWDQCFQTGEVRVAHRKGAANAGMPVDFGVEALSGGAAPYTLYFAGTTRVGS